jgi:hypothetical protein
MTTNPQVTRVLSLTARLTEALENDIVALKAGKAGDMCLPDPAIQQISLNYGREAAGLTPGIIKTLPAETRTALKAATKAFHDALRRHDIMLTRVRNASEGMIRAIAEEVTRVQNAARPYGARPNAIPPKPSAMLHNSVI